MARFAIVIAVVFAAAIVLTQASDRTDASSPGATVAPLLSCPNVDGSMEAGTGGVRIGDILTIVQAYFKDFPATNYVYMYDLVAPYNPSSGSGGKQRVDDILAVVSAYFDNCPLVDTQVAQATKSILTDPDAADLMACDEPALAAKGYVRSSQDVPGQGVHYMNFSLWDNAFSLSQSEGIVCQNGRLAALLYYMDGDQVGWGGHDVTAGPINGIDIDPFCSVSPCSWDVPEGWHAHSHMCLYSLGTAGAAAIYAPHDPACASFGEPHYYDLTMGWMGHLWNFFPNENQLSDVNSTMNGRFADCRPPFKHNTCPM
jgi:hypothetical protein